MEEKIKKRAIRTIDNFVSGFTAKNMHICNIQFCILKEENVKKAVTILEMVVRMIDAIRRIRGSYAI